MHKMTRRQAVMGAAGSIALMCAQTVRAAQVNSAVGLGIIEVRGSGCQGEEGSTGDGSHAP